MIRVRDLPLRRKVALVLLATCAAALTLTCFALGVYDFVALKQALARDIGVLAEVLGANSRAALAFRDEEAASRVLATLTAEPQVVAAAVYDARGIRLARYLRSGTEAELSEAPEPTGHRFDATRLLVFRTVLLDGRQIGTIHLHANLEGVYERLRLLAVVAALSLAGTLLVAGVLSPRLQRTVSRPILNLAETARRISEHRDFSLRAAQEGRDEVGQLTAAFNEMIGGIESRERALRETNEALSRENAERLAAESRVQAQLASLELLNRITRAIGERQDLPSIVQVVVGSLEDDLPIDFGSICYHDAAGAALIVASSGVRAETLAQAMGLTPGARIALDTNGLSRCIRGHLVYEPDTREAPSPFARLLAEHGLHSLVAAPLQFESSVFGVLFAARRQERAFSSNECQFLRQLSEHVALVAHQAQLYGALQQAYDDLRQTQQAVMQQERLRALGEMASGIAHDINNAITPVALYADLLGEEPELGDTAREYLEIARQGIHDVAATVGRMREFYRAREPQLELHAVKVNPLLQQVIELTRPRWSTIPLQRGVVIRIRADLAPQPLAVLGVESELREALVNLVFNAVDALPDGGTITLRTRLDRGEPGGPATAAPDRVLIEVVDNGVGMDEETSRRCLEPFFTTKGEQGTGLGLAMVYGTLQRHSADIEIESSPGVGTTVRLTFGVPGEPAAEPSLGQPAPAPAARLRILAVDDDPLVLRSVSHALTLDGHQVHSARGGQEGIDAFRAALEREEPFAAVISDLGMPHVDGRAVASAVKESSPATPVILLTGWGQRLLFEGGVPPHVDRVLSKPPKLGELRMALAECCRPRGGEA